MMRSMPRLDAPVWLFIAIINLCHASTGMAKTSTAETSTVGSATTDGLGPQVCESPCQFVEKLAQFNITGGAQFGYALAVDGDVAVVGARYDGLVGIQFGAAYVFRWNGTQWAEEQILLPDDHKAIGQARFGNSVAISGDVIVVGALEAFDGNHRTGGAYVFRWDGQSWQQEQRLRPDVLADVDEFGYSVAVSGDVAMVGARLDERVYIFENLEGWEQTQYLDGLTSSLFGYSISLSDGIAVIGAHKEGNAGAAYVFEPVGESWTETQRLTGDGGSNIEFGQGVFVAGETIMVGAPRDDEAAENAGAVFVFERNGPAWEIVQKILPIGGGANARFGQAISMLNDWAVIGAWVDAPVKFEDGSAYIFHREASTWIRKQKLFNDDGEYSDYFGHSVAATNHGFLIGEFNDDFHANNNGSVSYYRFDPLDVNNDGVIDLADHAFFADCLTGTGQFPDLGCEPADLNHSDAVDLADFAAWQVVYPCP